MGLFLLVPIMFLVFLASVKAIIGNNPAIRYLGFAVFIGLGIVSSKVLSIGSEKEAKSGLLAEFAEITNLISGALFFLMILSLILFLLFFVKDINSRGKSK